jgi:hypothetical protein
LRVGAIDDGGGCEDGCRSTQHLATIHHGLFLPIGLWRAYFFSLALNLAAVEAGL